MQQQQRLNTVPNTNVLHLRAGYFMENLLMSIPHFKQTGIFLSVLARGDVKIEMVATKISQ